MRSVRPFFKFFYNPKMPLMKKDNLYTALAILVVVGAAIYMIKKNTESTEKKKS